MRQNRKFPYCLLVVFAIPLCFIGFIVKRYGVHLVDDGYYYLQIAYHLAQGNGFTFDGIHQTNGFQPLWQIVLIPFFWLFDKSTMPYVVTAVQSLLFLGSGLFLFLTLHKWLKNSLSCIGTFVWLANIWVISKGAVTGMETALVLFLMGLFYYLLPGILDKQRYYTAGLVLTLLLMARLDMIFLTVAVFVIIFFYGDDKKKMLIAVSIPVGFLILYLIVNSIHTGMPSPVSGLLKTHYGKALLLQMVEGKNIDFVHHFVFNLKEFITLGRFPLPVSAIGLSGFILFIFFAIPRVTKAVSVITLVHLLFSVMLFTFYFALYENILTPYKYYWLPVLYGFVFLALLLSSALSTGWLRVGIFLSLALFTLIFSIAYYTDLLASVFYTIPDHRSPRYKVVQYINKNIPQDAILGSWDAGYLGYYCRQYVINLDGYVNDKRLYKHIIDDRLYEYIEKEEIGYLVNKDCHGYKHRFILDHIEDWKRLHVESLSLKGIQQKTAFTINPNVLEAAQYDTLEYYIYMKKSKPANKDN
ncbi:hypothetical protein GF407_05910 [candidate division KSB1 bacterium]|nr:hypothetical protein [candidate division KSB1 bacterium]